MTKKNLTIWRTTLIQDYTKQKLQKHFLVKLIFLFSKFYFILRKLNNIVNHNVFYERCLIVTTLLEDPLYYDVTLIRANTYYIASRLVVHPTYRSHTWTKWCKRGSRNRHLEDIANVYVRHFCFCRLLENTHCTGPS